MFLVLWLFVAHFTLAAIPTKNTTDNRFIVLSITAATLSEVSAFTTCIQPEFYPNQTPASMLMTPAGTCLTSVLGMVRMASFAVYVNNINTCLMKIGSSTADFSTKAALVLAPEFTGFYDTMQANFTAGKKSGKTTDQVLTGGYAMINARYKRAKVNELCIAVAKKINNSAQMRCAIDNAKPIVDFSTYDCYNYAKSSLLGK